MIAFSRPLFLLLFLLVPLLLWLHRHTFTALAPARRRASLWLRLVLLALLIVAAAGLRWDQPRTDLCTVFVLDQSLSADPRAAAAAEHAIRRAAAAMPPAALYGTVVFGDRALVLKAPGRTTMPVDRRTLNAEASNPADALRLAASLVPRGYGARLVLISDGRENRGDAAAAAEELLAAGAELDLLPLPARAGDLAALSGFELPRQARVDQPFEARVVIHSARPDTLVLSLYRDGALIDRYRFPHAGGGEVAAALPLAVTEPGFHHFRAQVEAPGDAVPQNNIREAFVQADGPPRVLIVTDAAAEADGVARALAAAKFGVSTAAGTALPPTLRDLRAYDAVILANVPATAIGNRGMENLRAYVRDGGGGLLMLGGPQSFGPGGYYRTPVEEVLPVTMDLRHRREMPASALVFCIDKSGSMCMTENGLTKLELAKKGAVLTAELLAPGDYIGVLGFDDAAFEVVPFGPLNSVSRVSDAIGTLQPGGGTNLFPSLQKAREWLDSIPAMNKHVIMLSDGCTAGGDHVGVATAMRAAGISVTSVSIGSDANLQLMEELADAGGGRFYVTREIADIPRIFTRETLLAVKKAVIEEPFTPVPGRTHDMLRGLETAALPQLRGYVGTSPKPQADVLLTTDKDDPLLTAIRSGLGKSVAFASDAGPRWAQAWLGWNGYTRFWEQAVRWALPDAGDPHVSCALTADGNRVRARLDVRDADGTYVNFLAPTLRLAGPDGAQAAATLVQTGTGRYEGETALPARGSYLVSVSEASNGSERLLLRTGLGYTCAPEYRTDAAASIIPRLRRMTGAAEVSDLSGSFRPRQQPVYANLDLWKPLLLLACVVFLFDIAVRRVDFRLAEIVAAFRQWRAGQQAAESGADLARVQRLHERVRQAPHRQAAPVTVPVIPPRPGGIGRADSAPSVSAAPPAATAPEPVSHTARLLEARKKARERFERPQ